MTETPVFPRRVSTILLLTALVFLIIGIEAIGYIVTIIAVSVILAMIVYPPQRKLFDRGTT